MSTLLREPDGTLSAYLQISLIWGEFKKKDSVNSINVRKEAEEEEEDCVKGVKTNFNTSFEFEEADKTMTELRNEAVRVRPRHRYEAAIKAGVSGVYSEHLKWIALAQYTIN